MKQYIEGNYDVIELESGTIIKRIQGSQEDQLNLPPIPSTLDQRIKEMEEQLANAQEAIDFLLMNGGM